MRRCLAGAAAGTLVATAAWAPMAFATHYEASLDGNSLQDPSLFEIDNDANLVLDDSPTPTGDGDIVMLYDWGNVTQTMRVDKVNGTGDDSYAGGVKEDTVCPGTTTDSIPPNKSDLIQFGAWEEEGSPGYLHLYWIRVTEPSGTTLMDFEFNQSEQGCETGPNKVRTVGDLLLEYAIDQGGAQAEMTLRTWTGTQWGPSVDVATDKNAAGTINQTAIPAGTDMVNLDGDPELEPLPAMSARTFGEASIDLNLIFDDEECSSFGSAMLKSRSSDSFTSQLKDFVAPIPLTLTNCGKVEITKQTIPDTGTTPLFGYTETWATDDDPDPDDPTFTLHDDQTFTADNVLFGTGYTVTEDDLPAGWEFDSVTCAASTGVAASIVGPTVTFAIDNASDVLRCTYTNRALADLTIVKQVNDAPGGQAFGFTTSSDLDADGFSLTPTGTGAAGQASTGAAYHDIAPGSYTVAETVPADWNLVSQTCTGGADTNPADGITLAAGESITCTFVNERERGAIEVTKTRKHEAAGGTDAHEGVAFTLTLKDPVGAAEEAWSQSFTATDATGITCLDDLLYDDYVVTETVPAGYVSDDEVQDVTVSAESTCGDGNEAKLSFVNTPLTNITVSVDSQIDGGTASTIVCVDAEGTVTPDSTGGTDGDTSATFEDLLPTYPTATLVCTITVDP